jgi:hypothetical protein
MNEVVEMIYIVEVVCAVTVRGSYHLGWTQLKRWNFEIFSVLLLCRVASTLGGLNAST